MTGRRTTRPTAHDDTDDLLGAYVLDAVDDVERRRVERSWPPTRRPGPRSSA